MFAQVEYSRGTLIIHCVAFKALNSVVKNMETKGIFQFFIIINVLVNPFGFI